MGTGAIKMIFSANPNDVYLFLKKEDSITTPGIADLPAYFHSSSQAPAQRYLAC